MRTKKTFRKEEKDPATWKPGETTPRRGKNKMNGSSKCCDPCGEKELGSRTRGDVGCGEPESTLRLTEPRSGRAWQT